MNVKVGGYELTRKQLDAANTEEIVLSCHTRRLVSAEGVALRTLEHGVHAHCPVLRANHFRVQIEMLREHAGIMHAHEPDLVQLGHGRGHKRPLLLASGLWVHVDHHVHGIVAEDTHTGLTHNLAAGNIWNVLREKVQHRLRDPNAWTGQQPNMYSRVTH